MSPENKQRIVGVVVLVAFIALLVPFLFSSGIRKKLYATDEMPISAQKRQLITQQIQSISNTNTTTATVTPPVVPAATVVPVAPAAPAAAAVQQTAQTTQPVTLSQDLLEQPDMLLPPESNLTEVAKNVDITIAEPAASPIKTILPKSKAVKKSNVVKKIKSKTIPLVKAKTGAINAKEFWSVQVGSFSDQVRVQKIVDQLNANGFHVYMQKITTATGSLTRVLVGHEVSKESASKIAARLETTMKIKGHLVRNQK